MAILEFMINQGKPEFFHHIVDFESTRPNNPRNHIFNPLRIVGQKLELAVSDQQEWTSYKTLRSLY